MDPTILNINNYHKAINNLPNIYDKPSHLILNSFNSNEMNMSLNDPNTETKNNNDGITDDLAKNEIISRLTEDPLSPKRRYDSSIDYRRNSSSKLNKITENETYLPNEYYKNSELLVPKLQAFNIVKNPIQTSKLKQYEKKNITVLPQYLYKMKNKNFQDKLNHTHYNEGFISKSNIMNETNLHQTELNTTNINEINFNLIPGIKHNVKLNQVKVEYSPINKSKLNIENPKDSKKYQKYYLPNFKQYDKFKKFNNEFHHLRKESNKQVRNSNSWHFHLDVDQTIKDKSHGPYTIDKNTNEINFLGVKTTSKIEKKSSKRMQEKLKYYTHATDTSRKLLYRAKNRDDLKNYFNNLN